MLPGRRGVCILFLGYLDEYSSAFRVYFERSLTGSEDIERGGMSRQAEGISPFHL